MGISPFQGLIEEKPAAACYQPRLEDATVRVFCSGGCLGVASYSDAYPNGGELRVLTAKLADDPSKGDSKLSALQNPPDGVAGGVIQIFGDAEAPMAFVA
jgi:hypothetical protein